MPKFFVKNNQIKDDIVNINGSDVNHIVNVLRVKKEDEIQVCNQDTGENYNARVIDYTKENVKCKIINKIDKTVESNINITIIQGIPKYEKMELIIQKNTEIGVKTIVPVIMERTIVKLNEKLAFKKLERWQKIAEIAAKQSMRDKIPKIENVIKFKQIEEILKNNDKVIVAYENEENNILKTELKKIKEEIKEKHLHTYNIAILIGPEGGISSKEIDVLEKYNSKIVSLGKRILRTETAGLVMASNILYELEEN